MASLDPPMVVVTAAVNEERAGCLIGFHAQGSIHPRRYAIWLSKANHTFRVAFLAQHLALHFLTRDDLDLADLFGTNSGDDMDKFELCDWAPSDDGPPLLLRCPNRLVLRRTGVLDEGSDHMCFVAEPVAAFASTRFEPLRLSDVSHLEPGHPVDERPLPPTTRAAE
jgi:flavin reductase (DIM6/NTAB) family NADH-FMN oxidoreductase RutF